MDSFCNLEELRLKLVLDFYVSRLQTHFHADHSNGIDVFLRDNPSIHVYAHETLPGYFKQVQVRHNITYVSNIWTPFLASSILYHKPDKFKLLSEENKSLISCSSVWLSNPDKHYIQFGFKWLAFNGMRIRHISLIF